MASSSSSSSQQISPLQWNNHAVLLLEMGRVEDASLLFQQALKTLGIDENRIVNRYTAAAATAATIETDNGNSHVPPPPKQAFTGWSCPLIQDEPAPCFMDHEQGGGGIFVYSRALHVHPVFRDDFFELYAAAILFNLGLTNHILAVRAEGPASTVTDGYYRNSSLLYDNAMKLLQQEQEPSQLDRNDNDNDNNDNNNNNNDNNTTLRNIEKNVLRTLLFNNMGHIFHTAYTNTEAATQCFTAVCSMIMDQHAQWTNAAALHDTDVTSLLRNLFTFLQPPTAAASA